MTINEDETGEVLALIDDVELPSVKLEVSAESSNPALVPVEGVSITSSGSKRTLTVTPSANAHGESVITITVSDGAKQASAAFTVTVKAVAGSPILSVARAVAGGLAVEWSGGGVLQSSADLKSWQVVENGASPFAADSAEVRKYFRVILE